MTTKDTPPSRRELHRKALMAAGSVVLALGIGGCAGATAYEVDDDDGELRSWTDDAYGGADSGVALSDTGRDTGCDTAVGSEDPSCLGIEDGAEVAACCAELFEWCAEEHAGDDDALMVCVYGEDFDGSTGCIPWGPPVPPRFRGALV